MNTKIVIALPDKPQFNAAITGLRLLRQVPLDIPVFTKPSPLEKKHNVVKVPWPIVYWVIDRDTHVKVSPIPMQNMGSSIGMDNTTA
jgi:hypothetical protein